MSGWVLFLQPPPAPAEPDDAPPPFDAEFPTPRALLRREVDHRKRLALECEDLSWVGGNPALSAHYRRRAAWHRRGAAALERALVLLPEGAPPEA